jgi:hypothetical protein
VFSLRSEFNVEGIVLSRRRLKNLDVSEKLAGFLSKNRSYFGILRQQNEQSSALENETAK